MLDTSKSQRQSQGLDIWKTNNFHGTFNYVQRFGKTRMIEISADRIRKHNTTARLMVLVPSKIAEENVKKLCKKYNIECYTTNSFYNAIDSKAIDVEKEIFVLYIDEIHKFTNDRIVSYIKKLKYKFSMGLTGSKLTNVQKSVITRIGFPIIDTITEEESIANGWTVDYDEFNLSVDISDEDKRRFVALNDAINSSISNFRGLYRKMNSQFGYTVFDSDFDLVQSLYSGKKAFNKGEYIEFMLPDKLRTILCYIQGYKDPSHYTLEQLRQPGIANIQKFWNPEYVKELAKTYIKAVKLRNDYLKYNVSKVNMVLELAENISDPMIIYNDSIDMIEHLSHAIKKPSVKYHSEMESVTMKDDDGNVICYKSGDKAGQPKLFGKTTLKKLAIDKISSGEVNILITGRSLSESLNLPNIKVVICTSGDTNPSNYDQRVARAKTVNSTDINKHSTIINLYIDDFEFDGRLIKSRDKEKLLIRQQNVKDVIFLENIHELFASIKK